MTDMAVIPAWVVQPTQEVADCHRIAHVVADDTGNARLAGIAASINWATGGQPSPLTERDGDPSAAVARAEMMAAYDANMPQELWSALGVEPREPVTENEGWREGVALTLGWLLGVHSRPPIPLPRRNPDGSTPSEEQLYREAVEARPHCSWEPEQHAEARSKARAEAARYARLAKLADSAG